MTPEEFKAVQRGYQLQLADQRDQILFGKQIPGMNADQPDQLEQLIRQLVNRNDDYRKEIQGEHRKGAKQLMTRRKLIQSLFD